MGRVRVKTPKKNSSAVAASPALSARGVSELRENSTHRLLV